MAYIKRSNIGELQQPQGNPGNKNSIILSEDKNSIVLTNDNKNSIILSDDNKNSIVLTPKGELTVPMFSPNAFGWNRYNNENIVNIKQASNCTAEEYTNFITIGESFGVSDYNIREHIYLNDPLDALEEVYINYINCSGLNRFNKEKLKTINKIAVYLTFKYDDANSAIQSIEDLKNNFLFNDIPIYFHAKHYNFDDYSFTMIDKFVIPILSKNPILNKNIHKIEMFIDYRIDIHTDTNDYSTILDRNINVVSNEGSLVSPVIYKNNYYVDRYMTHILRDIDIKTYQLDGSLPTNSNNMFTIVLYYNVFEYTKITTDNLYHEEWANNANSNFNDLVNSVYVAKLINIQSANTITINETTNKYLIPYGTINQFNYNLYKYDLSDGYNFCILRTDNDYYVGVRIEDLYNYFDFNYKLNITDINDLQIISSNVVINKSDDYNIVIKYKYNNEEYILNIKVSKLKYLPHFSIYNYAHDYVIVSVSDFNNTNTQLELIDNEDYINEYIKFDKYKELNVTHVISNNNSVVYKSELNYLLAGNYPVNCISNNFNNQSVIINDRLDYVVKLLEFPVIIPMPIILQDYNKISKDDTNKVSIVSEDHYKVIGIKTNINLLTFELPIQEDYTFLQLPPTVDTYYGGDIIHNPIVYSINAFNIFGKRYLNDGNNLYEALNNTLYCGVNKSKYPIGRYYSKYDLLVREYDNEITVYIPNYQAKDFMNSFTITGKLVKTIIKTNNKLILPVLHNNKLSFYSIQEQDQFLHIYSSTYDIIDIDNIYIANNIGRFNTIFYSPDNNKITTIDNYLNITEEDLNIEYTSVMQNVFNDINKITIIDTNNNGKELITQIPNTYNLLSGINLMSSTQGLIIKVARLVFVFYKYIENDKFSYRIFFGNEVISEGMNINVKPVITVDLPSMDLSGIRYELFDVSKNVVLANVQAICSLSYK